MNITNKTDYSTRDLRRIFIACEKNEGTNYSLRNVEVRYGKCDRVRGYAWYNSHSVVIKLPKMRKDGSRQANVHQLARVYIHEIGHNLNLIHVEMISWWDITIDFIEPGKIKFKLTSSNKKSTAEVNEEKARKKLIEWQKKLGRAKTFIKKYQRKVKYYDKKREKVAL